MTELVLASASLRRRELLAQLGLVFDVVAADVDESPRDGEPPVAYVRRLSIEKLQAVTARIGGDGVVVAADTTVDLGGRILGKPADAAEARAMLMSLSGTTHDVHTGVSVASAGRIVSDVATTAVTFVNLTPDVLGWYIATGEPFDKAGAYAIQGAGAVLVERVSGSVSNIIGLPLALLANLMEELGVSFVSMRRT